jgi:hypothetical protein
MNYCIAMKMQPRGETLTSGPKSDASADVFANDRLFLAVGFDFDSTAIARSE